MTTPTELRAPVDMRTQAATLRDKAQRQAERQLADAEQRAQALEARAAKAEQAEARRAAIASYRHQAQEARERLDALRAQATTLKKQIVACGKKQSEIGAGRADAVARATALRDEVRRLVSEGADVTLVAEKRSQADALTAVAQDYDAGSWSAQAAAAQQQLDAMGYGLEHALSEVESFEALIEDPFGEQARAQFEANRARVLEERAARAREQTNHDRIRRHAALEQLPPTWSRR